MEIKFVNRMEIEWERSVVKPRSDEYGVETLKDLNLNKILTTWLNRNHEFSSVELRNRPYRVIFFQLITYINLV